MAQRVAETYLNYHISERDIGEMLTRRSRHYVFVVRPCLRHYLGARMLYFLCTDKTSPKLCVPAIQARNTRGERLGKDSPAASSRLPPNA